VLSVKAIARLLFSPGARNDPVVLTDVRKRLTELGLGSFSNRAIKLIKFRTVFLNHQLGVRLLGGISFISRELRHRNTMIMSILERTREIGIMKSIGAEDREIQTDLLLRSSSHRVTGGGDRLVGGLGIRRSSESFGLSFHTGTAGRVVRRFSFTCRYGYGWERSCSRWVSGWQHCIRRRAPRGSIRCGAKA